MRRLAGLITCVVVGAAAAAALAADATVVPGDKISGRLGDGDSDTLQFAVGSPASLQVKTKLRDDLRVALTLYGPDGKQVVTGAAYRNPTSNKPGLKGVELRRLGTYRLVVSRTAGAGDYQVKMSLRSPKPREVNLAGAPTAEPTMNVDADQVVFEKVGNALSSTNVQDAIEETIQKVLTTEQELNTQLFQFGDQLTVFDQTITSFGADIDAVEALADDTVTTVEDALAAFSQEVSDLDERVDTFDGGGDLVRVLYTLPQPQSVGSEAYYIDDIDRDTFRVRRHLVASVTVGPDEIDSFVKADVKFDFTPSFAPGSNQQRLGPPGRIVWAEVGNRDVFGPLEGGYNYTGTGVWQYDMLGIRTTTDAYSAFDYHTPLFFQPTAAERASGFTMNIYISMWVYEEPTQDITLNGFSLNVHTAVVRGQ